MKMRWALFAIAQVVIAVTIAILLHGEVLRSACDPLMVVAILLTAHLTIAKRVTFWYAYAAFLFTGMIFTISAVNGLCLWPLTPEHVTGRGYAAGIGAVVIWFSTMLFRFRHEFFPADEA